MIREVLERMKNEIVEKFLKELSNNYYFCYEDCEDCNLKEIVRFRKLEKLSVNYKVDMDFTLDRFAIEILEAQKKGKLI